MNPTPLSSHYAVRLFDSKPSETFEQYANAMILLHGRLDSVNIQLDGKPIKLDNLVGKGGSKMAYDLGDGTVLLLPNMLVEDANPQLWNRVVMEEVAMAKRVRDCGLRAQEYEATIITINESPLIVIKTPSFSGMQQRGLQIRDRKRPLEEKIPVLNLSLPKGFEFVMLDPDRRIGSSDLFGTIENLTDPKYWEKLYSDIAEDVALLLVNDLEFDSDTYNLVIEDTEQTPAYSPTKRDSIRARSQRIRLYFYDFSTKNEVLDDEDFHFQILDQDGNLLEENIKRYVTNMLIRFTSTILQGASMAECRAITGKDCPMFYALELNQMSQSARETATPGFIAEVISAVKQKIDDTHVKSNSPK